MCIKVAKFVELKGGRIKGILDGASTLPISQL